MKKTFHLILIVAMILCNISAFAQKPFAGTILFETSVEGTTDPNIAAQISEMTQEYLVMGNNFRNNANQGIDIITIGNGTNKTLSIILGIPGMGKYYIQQTAEDIEKKMNSTQFNYNYTDENMTIAGYKCQKVVVNVIDNETDEETDIILYVTKELGLGDDINFSTYPGLKGYPLRTESKTEINGETVTIIQTASEIKANKKVKASSFLMPSDAQPIESAPEELKQALGFEE